MQTYYIIYVCLSVCLFVRPSVRPSIHLLKNRTSLLSIFCCFEVLASLCMCVCLWGDGGRSIKVGNNTRWIRHNFKITNTRPDEREIYFDYHTYPVNWIKDIHFRIILSLVLYWCETWSLTLREEHRLRVFEKRLLRRILGPKADEVTGSWKNLHKEELHNLYSSPIIIRMIK
jgi:hypothetical protein